MKDFFKKEKVTILITDSGYGGLSVCAEIERKFRSYFPFKEVQLIFFNSQPKSDLGFNHIKTNERKVRILNNALHGMIKWYNPDIILIACNTLSVLYPETKFSKEAKIPVIGIIDFGVDMIMETIQDKKNTSVIIFGSETTIAASAHKNKLISKGISSDKIVNQACKDLAGKIESAPHGEAVKNLIKLYSDESVTNLKNKNDKIVVGLFCTHYGYCADQFYNSLKENNLADVQILDPNSRMAEYIFLPELRTRYKSSSVFVKVVSRVKIEPQEIKSLGGLLQSVSPETVKAFKNNEFRENLFKVD
jgi:glutamate racemase